MKRNEVLNAGPSMIFMIKERIYTCITVYQVDSINLIQPSSKQLFIEEPLINSFVINEF